MNNDLKVKIELIHPDAKIPVRSSLGAACWDVFAAEVTTKGNNITIVNLGFKLEIPSGYKMVIVPRSSITSTNLVIQNSPCQIDSDYRGNVMVKFYDLKQYNSHILLTGERIAQMYLEKVNEFSFEEGIVNTTERGEGGFGSTGK